MQSQTFKLLLLAFAVGGCSDAGEEYTEELGTTEQAITTTLEFQDGGLPTPRGALYYGTRDARLSSKAPDGVFGDRCRIAGAQTGNEQSCVIMFFNLANYIPQSAIIQSVTLFVNVTDPSPESVEVSALLQHWKESAVTWNSVATGFPWGLPGAKSSSDRGPGFTKFTASAVGRFGIDLGDVGRAKVQEALALGNSAVNGFILSKPAIGNALEFDASEHVTRANRPSLRVTYTN